KDKVAIIVDDLVDTGNTITRAAKLVKERGGATKVYAIVTHAILSGDAIERINASALDKVVVTNSVPQHEHLRRCHKLEVLDVSSVFAEVCFGFPNDARRIRESREWGNWLENIKTNSSIGYSKSPSWREY